MNKILSFAAIAILILTFAFPTIKASGQQIKLYSYSDSIAGDTTIKNITYTIHVGSKGGRYILRTSKTTGNIYKQYLPKQ